MRTLTWIFFAFRSPQNFDEEIPNSINEDYPRQSILEESCEICTICVEHRNPAPN